MLDGLRETLSNINVTLDRYTWESGYIADGSAKAIVEKLKESKYAGKTDDGAWFVDLKDFGVQGKNTKFTFTRSDGTAGASFEINASNLQLLTSRSEVDGGYNPGAGSAGAGYAGSTDMGPGGNYDMDPDSEDIPF